MIQTGNVSVLPEKCHGCEGKGWVVAISTAQKCPVCDGSGVKPSMFFSYPPLKIEYTAPATTETYICPICKMKNCNTTHASCYDASKYFVGGATQKEQTFVRLEARC